MTWLKFCARRTLEIKFVDTILKSRLNCFSGRHRRVISYMRHSTCAVKMDRTNTVKLPQRLLDARVFACIVRIPETDLDHRRSVFYASFTLNALLHSS